MQLGFESFYFTFPMRWDSNGTRKGCIESVRNPEAHLRNKPHKHRVREKPEALTVTEVIDQVKSMDFMHD